MTGTETEFRNSLSRRLDELARRGHQIQFWWRDDDAIEPSDALERLIALSEQFEIPVGLAVIPQGATQTLADRLDAASTIAVLQHGWAHQNHQGPESKKMELGDARAANDVLAELDRGRLRLQDLFGKGFLPVLVPPWNRIAPEVAAQRQTAGLVGLSTFGKAGPGADHVANTHVDIIAWRKDRGFVGWQRACELIDQYLTDRLESGSNEPIGILTHHLDHDAGCWRFLEIFLGVACKHPAAIWPPISDLFALKSG